MSRGVSPERLADTYLELGPSIDQLVTSQDNPTEQSRLLDYVEDVIEDVGDALDDGAELITDKVTGFWEDFSEFINRGNVIELGVGILIGAAFGNLLDSFVNDILTPPFSFLNRQGSTLRNYFYVLIPGASGAWQYITLDDALQDGATTENVGLFLEHLLRFMVMGLALYFVIKGGGFDVAYSRFKKAITVPVIIEPAEPKKKCLWCCSMIPTDAHKCAFCTSLQSELPPVSCIDLGTRTYCTWVNRVLFLFKIFSLDFFLFLSIVFSLPF